MNSTYPTTNSTSDPSYPISTTPWTYSNPTTTKHSMTSDPHYSPSIISITTVSMSLNSICLSNELYSSILQMSLSFSIVIVHCYVLDPVFPSSDSLFVSSVVVNAFPLILLYLIRIGISYVHLIHF